MRSKLVAECEADHKATFRLLMAWGMCRMRWVIPVQLVLRLSRGLRPGISHVSEFPSSVIHPSRDSLTDWTEAFSWVQGPNSESAKIQLLTGLWHFNPTPWIHLKRFVWMTLNNKICLSVNTEAGSVGAGCFYYRRVCCLWAPPLGCENRLKSSVVSVLQPGKGSGCLCQRLGLWPPLTRPASS